MATKAALCLIAIGLLLAACDDKPKTDRTAIRFNMPRCHKLPNGLTECYMKKLTTEQRR